MSWDRAKEKRFEEAWYYGVLIEDLALRFGLSRPRVLAKQRELGLPNRRKGIKRVANQEKSA
jgi:hypothetical protein